MKSKRLMIVLSIIALTYVSFAEPLSEQVLIKTTVRLEKMVDGKLESRIISTPVALTIIGEEMPEVNPTNRPAHIPKYSVKVLPNGDVSDFFLEGEFETPTAPSNHSLVDGGSISVQEPCIVKFSLNVCENIPYECSTASRADGSKLVFTFLTSRPTQEEMARRVSRFTNSKDYKKTEQTK